MKERFAWAKGARLIEAVPQVARDLRIALSGQPFRLGGDGALEAGEGEFETLTSGSSRAPRRVLRTMASWTASFAVNCRLFGTGHGARVAVLGGMEQSLALYGAVEALHLGADLQALGGQLPARQMAMLQSCDILWASPAQLRLLLRAGGELPKLAHVIVGGSKLDDALRGALGQRTGARICEFYGAAEASFITLAQDDLAKGSVGVPYPGVDLALRNDGEVWVRSPYLFQRYAGADLDGAARWDGDWLSVGERGQIRGGRLFLLGREGRMVTVADQNVFPEEIEAQIMAMAGVSQAAVLPRHDALRGVHLIAIAQGDPKQEAVILAQLRAGLGPLRAPKAMMWCQDWPLLPSGKTDLVALQRAVDAAGDIWR